MIIDNVTCPVCHTVGPKRILRNLGDYQCLSCPVCLFQFIHPYDTGRPAFDDYEWTKEYTDNYEKYIGPVIESLKEKVLDVERIVGRKPASFLDIGCGNGLYLNAANTLGMRNLGTDIDRINVRFAKTKGLNAVAADILDLELSEQYEFVHLKAVLHLVPDPMRMLKRAAELAAPGGVIYVDVPNQGSLFSKLRKLRDRATCGQLQLPLRRGAFNIHSLKYLCERAGLRIARRVYAYPGDKIYYPILEMNRLNLGVFKVFAKLRITSFLGAYLVAGDDVHAGKQDR